MTKLSKISILVFVSTFLGQITVANCMAIKTRELNQVAQQIVDVQNHISILNQQIYLASAIGGMEQKAKDHGFLSTQVKVNTITTPTIARAF